MTNTNKIFQLESNINQNPQLSIKTPGDHMANVCFPFLGLPRWCPPWPAAACQACWPTATWPLPPSSSAACSEPPASAATLACAGQSSPVGRCRHLHKHTIVLGMTTAAVFTCLGWGMSQCSTNKGSLDTFAERLLHCLPKSKSKLDQQESTLTVILNKYKKESSLKSYLQSNHLRAV